VIITCSEGKDQQFNISVSPFAAIRFCCKYLGNRFLTFTANIFLSQDVHRLQIPLSVNVYLKSFLSNFQKVYVFV